MSNECLKLNLSWAIQENLVKFVIGILTFLCHLSFGFCHFTLQ